MQNRCINTYLEPVLPEVFQQLLRRPLLLCWPCISEACQHHWHSWGFILSHKLLNCQVLHTNKIGSTSVLLQDLHNLDLQ